MLKSKLTLAGLIFILIAAMLACSCSDSDDDNENSGITQAQSHAIAEQFIKGSPTFTFDGITESLTLTETIVLRCPSCWQFIFDFESRHAGYGDRTDQMLAQVITPHKATITVSQGTVTSADLNGKWDMLKQEIIGQNSSNSISVNESSSGQTIQATAGATITVTLDSNPTTGYEWSLVSISDESVLKEESHIFEAPQATELPAIGAGGTEIWTFKTTGEGSSTISMAYSRSWESVPPVESFKLTIHVGDQNPSSGDSDFASQIEANNNFAFDLYQALKAQDGNLLYSPYSISLALAMTYAGARGETEAQMAETLNFILSQEDLPAEFKAIATQLASRGQVSEGKDSEGFRLNISNDIWGQEDYQFLTEFLQTLEENYNAEMRLLDFARAPEEARITINDWISQQTEGKIQDLIPEGVIDALTRLVLTNAVYFNAAWQHPFTEESTQDGTFHLIDGAEITVPMMNQTESFGYAKGEGFQVVELPYDGHELSMVILLPEKGAFDSFQDNLTATQVNSIIRDMNNKQVSLSLPKFSFESSFILSKNLASMGMPDAFNANAADFSGIDGTRNLSITEVVHKAFIDVDEAGTEAAAATAVIISLTSINPEMPVEVTIDSPFIFLIRDIQTDTILFTGRVMNPK